LVWQVAEYIVQSGGKRLRPALVLLSAGRWVIAVPHHHELAAVIEFIHTATLLHDDVVDASDLRRGRDRRPMRCSATRPACWLAISCIRGPFR
jgi:octaprenyl-diphosphate synthase